MWLLYMELLLALLNLLLAENLDATADVNLS